MSDTTDTLFIRTGGAFLDPADVGSAAQYRIAVKETKYDSGGLYVNLTAQISLSDCTRWISWDLEGDEAEAKIDAALAILLAAKADLKRAKKVVAAATKRAEATKAVPR